MPVNFFNVELGHHLPYHDELPLYRWKKYISDVDDGDRLNNFKASYARSARATGSQTNHYYSKLNYILTESPFMANEK